MRQTRAIEVGTGLFVVLGLAALFFMVTEITAERVGVQRQGYELSAKFDQIGGLKVGAPVSMAGVTIGRVTDISFDDTDYRALVRMRIDHQFSRIPDDSDAGIFTQGLLGNQYIGMAAGLADTFFDDQDRIELTHSALVLEKLIGKFLLSMAGRGGDEAAEENLE
jgi:phospholipid/cholesterol/gamma-HCH transport system substrate-binding protein